MSCDSWCDMVKVKEDLTGKVFDRLIVIKQVEDYIDSKGKHYAQWMCQCKCEEHKTVIVRGSDLKNGHSRSCGCIKNEKASERLRTKHKTNNYSKLLSDEYGNYYIGWTTNTNKEFYVDEEDFDKIKDYCWIEHILTNGYHALEARTIGTKTNVRMHWIILGKYYDHKDRNPLNNRKYNLRKATQLENAKNNSISKNNTSGITGVFWNEKNKVWTAGVRIDGKFKYLRSFSNKNDAIKVRLRAVQQYYGEFSSQNDLYKQYGIVTEE